MGERTSRAIGSAQIHIATPTTLSVAWVASHPAVTSVLVGGRNVEQLARNVVIDTVSAKF